jgi:hypothetical protein
MLAVFAVNVAASGGLMTMFPVVTTENQVRVGKFADTEAALIVLVAAAASLAAFNTGAATLSAF